MQKKRRYKSHKSIRLRTVYVFLAALLCLLAAAWQFGRKETDDTAYVLLEVDEEELLAQLPPYEGAPSVEINGGVPFSMEPPEADEDYGPLDALGRCTRAFARVGPETLPLEEREDVRAIRPSGWNNARYEGIDKEFLFNRCHLIGYQLTGENANERNLITGTRYMNVEGMLPYENAVGSYVRRTGHHVLYRVTPLFRGSDLIAAGVLMEAQSVEDDGLRFCVFCYNVQPGIEIDYVTGESSGPGRLAA